jgi:hypothetical protein
MMDSLISRMKMRRGAMDEQGNAATDEAKGRRRTAGS